MLAVVPPVVVFAPAAALTVKRAGDDVTVSPTVWPFVGGIKHVMVTSYVVPAVKPDADVIWDEIDCGCEAELLSRTPLPPLTE